MAKRILVPLDGSVYSKNAVNTAIDIALKTDGTVIGLGIIDKEEIEDSVIGAGIGASYFAEHLEQHKMNNAIKKVRNFLEDFEAECKTAKVKYEVYKKSGVPFEMIVELGKTSDIIVIGLKTFFHFETSPKEGETLKDLLEVNVCPILAVPKTEVKLNGNVLIAADGSVKASKAMRVFTHISRDNSSVKKMFVLNVNDNIEESDKILKGAKNYLETHGFKVETFTRVGNPEEEIIKFSKEMNISTIVMGAYGNSDLSALLFGRTSLKVIENGEVPIFFYH